MDNIDKKKKKERKKTGKYKSREFQEQNKPLGHRCLKWQRGRESKERDGESGSQVSREERILWSAHYCQLLFISYDNKN